MVFFCEKHGRYVDRTVVTPSPMPDDQNVRMEERVSALDRRLAVSVPAADVSQQSGPVAIVLLLVARRTVYVKILPYCMAVSCR